MKTSQPNRRHTVTRHYKPSTMWQAWTVLLVVPLFLSACVSSRPTRTWIDPNFAKGNIPIGKLELLPMSLAVHIDGVGRATWDQVRHAHKRIATLVDQQLQARLSSKGYKLFLGRMSRQRLYHLISQVQNAAGAAAHSQRPTGVNPILVAGGAPGTDTVVVVEGLANVTTGGKRALQVTTIVLIVVFIVVVLIAIIAAAAAAGKGKKSGKKSRARSRRSSRSRRTRLTRRSRRTRTGRTRSRTRSRWRDSKRFRSRRSAVRWRRYHRHRLAYRRYKGRRYYRGYYRHRGRIVRYRMLRHRPLILAPSITFYSPDYAPGSSAPAPPQNPEHKQGFFSSSFLDLNISFIEKGTGTLLWHQSKRWKIDPTNPQQLQTMAGQLFESLPNAHPDAFKNVPSAPPPGTTDEPGPPDTNKQELGPPGTNDEPPPPGTDTKTPTPTSTDTKATPKAPKTTPKAAPKAPPQPPGSPPPARKQPPSQPPGSPPSE